MASLTRLVRSVSGRQVVAATIIEHPDTIKANELAAAKAKAEEEKTQKLEKVVESTPADGGGQATKKKKGGGKKNKGKDKIGDVTPIK